MAKLTFDDEFNSLSFWNGTSGTWQPSYFYSPNGFAASDMTSWWVNPSYGPTSAADANPYSIVNGALNLAIMPTPSDVSSSAVGGENYLAGLVTTYKSFSQEYGYFEINAQMSSATGSMSAFWLMPESGAWPPEIDIAEVLASNPAMLATTAHTATQSAQEQGLTTVANMTTSYNTYAVDWEADTITWYFNGKQVYQIATPADMHQPMYVLLDADTGTRSSWEGAPTSASETGAMKINYVHVWNANPYTSGQPPTPPPPVPPPAPPPPPAPGPHTLTLRMSEDAWSGDAQFVVQVDGHQIGVTQTTSALNATGDSNVFQLTGNWSVGSHSVGIQFLNDSYGGTPATDRNLYIGSIAYDGVTYGGTAAAMYGNGTDSFTVGGSAPTATGPADTIVLHLSEDAWQGDAQFTVSIDGKQITTPQAATASHTGNRWQDVAVAGNLGTGTHTIGVTFTNDAYGGTSSTDRNLYVNGIDVNGQHYGAGVTTLLSNGTASFTVYTQH